MEAQSCTDTTRTTASLGSVASCYECFDQSTQLLLLVKPEDMNKKIISIIPVSDVFTHLISRCFPESITQVMSGIVIPVSAILVAGNRLLREITR